MLRACTHVFLVTHLSNSNYQALYRPCRLLIPCSVTSMRTSHPYCRMVSFLLQCCHGDLPGLLQGGVFPSAMLPWWPPRFTTGWCVSFCNVAVVISQCYCRMPSSQCCHAGHATPCRLSGPLPPPKAWNHYRLRRTGVLSDWRSYWGILLHSTSDYLKGGGVMTEQTNLTSNSSVLSTSNFYGTCWLYPAPNSFNHQTVIICGKTVFIVL